ncbi:MAG: PorV/PorQ family protein [Elusimicrobia bacterium]|nr:PorV/PorQ family protein [Elusimicrobiota bacterium]
MNKKFAIFSFIIIVCNLPLSAEMTGASFLKIGIGARAAGLGNAFTAISDDATAMYWNPAGLVQLTGPQLLMTHTKWIADTNHNFIGYSGPMKNGVIGAGIIYLSQGSMEGRDDAGQKTNNFAARDMAVTVSYGNMISKTANYGVNVKLIRQQIANEKADGIAIDLGLMKHFKNSPIALGISIQNVGSKMKFVSQSYDLPLSMNIGTSYNIGGIMIAMDIKRQIYEKNTRLSIGSEYMLMPTLALRTGYLMSDESYGINNLSGLGVGIGIRALGLQTDYSFMPYALLGNAHRISFTAKF